MLKFGGFPLQYETLGEKRNCLELLPYVGIKKIEMKVEESERPAVTRNPTQDTWLVQPVLCH